MATRSPPSERKCIAVVQKGRQSQDRPRNVFSVQAAMRAHLTGEGLLGLSPALPTPPRVTWPPHSSVVTQHPPSTFRVELRHAI